MFSEETLEELLDEERRLTFPRFDNEDAFRLGCMLYADGAEEEAPYAIRIVVDDLIAFQAFMPGTGAENSNWLDRKCATVMHTGSSSYHAFVAKELYGEKEEWQRDGAYALYGGGFPLTVDGQLHGVIAISGMPHAKDHARVVQTIEKFLRSEA